MNAKAPGLSKAHFFAHCIMALATAAARADGAASTTTSTQTASDGFSVTPEMLSPSGSSSGSSDAATLGLEYKFQKTLPVTDPIPIGANFMNLSGQVSGSGKVAANSSVNVGDLIDTAGTFGAEFYHLAYVPLPNEPQTPSFNADSTLNLKASLEAGQRLSTHQYTYGISSSNQLTPSNLSDVFSHFNWPTLLLEFARVDPTDDTARKAVDPTLADYNRFHFRVSGGVKLFSVEGRMLRIDAKYDHWQEVSPSKAIVAADLNAQTYRAFSIVFVGHGTTPDWVITYANGNVPTDQASSKVWQLGWQWNVGGKSGG
jgi:hypothetical protein